MTPAASSQTIPIRLHPVLPVLSILVVALLALWPSLASLLRYWRTIMDYEHSFLIAAIIVVWIVRDLWRGAVRFDRPSWAAVVLMAPLLLLWIVSVRGSIDIAHQLLWPMLLAVSVWAVAGAIAARQLAPAIGLLYCTIPVWDYGLPVLQRLSIFFSEHILALLRVPAEVSEYHVTIPEGTFAIVEGCSGKRYVIVTLAVAYLAIFINRLVGWRALLFLAAAGLMSLVTNWIRIVVVIYSGHVTNMQGYLVAVEHKTLGYALFVILIAAVLLLGWWMSRGRGEPMPVVNEAREPGSQGAFRGLMLVPAAMLLVAVPMRHVGAPAGSLRLGTLPLETGRWQGPLPPQAGWQPEFWQPDDQQRVAYVSEQGAVELYVNLYAYQQTGRELVQYVNKLVAPALWTETWSAAGGHLEAGGRSWSIQEMDGPDQRHWIVVYGYMVRSHAFRSGLAAKLAYGWLSISGPAPAGVMAAAAPCDARNCDNARKLVADFWENMQLPMEAIMPVRPAPSP